MAPKLTLELPGVPSLAQPEDQNASHRETILFMAACPRDTQQFNFSRELREISDELQRGKYRERFKLESRLGVRLKDISQALTEYAPWIVHFSGHCSEGTLIVEDESGFSDPISTEGLAAIFGVHADVVKCVVLMAANTLPLAEALMRNIDYVIALRGTIEDNAAIMFSGGFYQGLAGGLSVDESFKRALALLRASSFNHAEDRIPVLIKKASTSSKGS